MDASDPDPGPQEREMNCRPAVGSENCGPVIIVFEGREGAPLLSQTLLLLLLLLVAWYGSGGHRGMYVLGLVCAPAQFANWA